VDSTTFATVGYDDQQQLLQLEFCSGAVYHYFGVPAAVHAALSCAPSKGCYFNQAIRGRFRYGLVPTIHSDAPDGQIPAGCR
jgi:hypothetical protein